MGIFILQKRAVRVLTNSDFRAHSALLFLQLKILDIFKLNEFHVAKFMFCYHHQILPPPLFSNLFLNKFIIITLDLQTITDRIITEPTQKNSLFSFKVLLYGILCLPTLSIQKPSILFQEKT